jgi:hypothetical protein
MMTNQVRGTFPIQQSTRKTLAKYEMNLKPQNPESPPPVFFTIPSALPIHFTWVYTTGKMETDLGCKGLSQRHASFLIVYIDTSPSNPPCFKILLDPCSRISDNEREATPLLGYTK